MFDVGEISVTQIDLLKTLTIFYLLVIGKQVSSSLFPCFEIIYLKKSKYLQLFIAFLLFYFLVVIVSNTNTLRVIPPIQKLFYAIFYFICFIFLMRLDIRISLLVIFLIFLVYFLELNKTFYLEKGKEITENEEIKRYNDNYFWFTLDWPIKIRLLPVKEEQFMYINKICNILFYAIVVLVIIGFIVYAGQLKSTLNLKQISLSTVITDTKVCYLKHNKSFWHYFKLGLGII